MNQSARRFDHGQIVDRFEKRVTLSVHVGQGYPQLHAV
jgi:hypothetical protein